MASPALLTPASKLKPLSPVKPKPNSIAPLSPPPTPQQQQPRNHHPRRHFLSSATAILTSPFVLPITPAFAGSDEEYVKDTEDVINKYRREKALLGRASFRDMYSALNAVTGHYISFGPTAPIPSKRRARILEEMDTAEKALSRGR
ncbi:photosystem 2 family protein [Populus alba x Populus x berolinensis]|nr:photosystem 2 family protein [Populus alba x Populus x berolinensis]